MKNVEEKFLQSTQLRQKEEETIENSFQKGKRRMDTYSNSSQAQVNPSITVVNVEHSSNTNGDGSERGGGSGTKTIIRTNSASQLNTPTTKTEGGTQEGTNSKTEQVTSSSQQPRLRREPSINYSVINPYMTRNGMRQDSLKTHPTRTDRGPLQHQQSLQQYQQQKQQEIKSHNEWQASFEMIPGRLFNKNFAEILSKLFNYKLSA